MIKAIFFDIDGTLVSFNTHRIPQSTIDALALVRQKGIKVFIATGRHLLAINNLGNEKFDGFVTMNGSYCIDEKGEAVYKHKIPVSDIESLLDYLENTESFPCILVQENSMLMNYKNEKVQQILDMLNFPEPPSGNLKDLPKDDVYQLIAFFEEHQEERIMQVLPGSESTRWSPLFTDVVPKGSNKSVGIDKLLENYGITPQETMAFGDGGNDIEMLKHVGVGIAMGNAEEEVKRVADYVTDTVDNDGILKALKDMGVV
ncbi:Cof-type HAD-IIB family hydrolase [Massilibacteroides sp.]|uniref:Cof-type HAD-IIB family hydrolase n=1 Tax=Massilibacteroides sp. TaxID=2034766 RepID=UPI00260D3DD4|nr:Cof-type HAD-IIB family hydrolase [Massilibacteroides sp.]MDD4515567.1 Cof-type HAD-IIB family hydrolase [Massilibacteroides sp.]